jgi:autophagy-related protein 17
VLIAQYIEERTLREAFRAEHGDHLPDDLCLSVDNPPTRWDVLSVPGGMSAEERERRDVEHTEVLPDVDIDLLVEAREKVQSADGGFGIGGSLGSI